MSFVEELRQGLEKTRKNFTERMEDLVGISVDLDEDFMDELEMILVAGDVGIKTTEKIMQARQQRGKSSRPLKPCLLSNSTSLTCSPSKVRA